MDRNRAIELIECIDWLVPDREEIIETIHPKAEGTMIADTRNVYRFYLFNDYNETIVTKDCYARFSTTDCEFEFIRISDRQYFVEKDRNVFSCSEGRIDPLDRSYKKRWMFEHTFDMSDTRPAELEFNNILKKFKTIQINK